MTAETGGGDPAVRDAALIETIYELPDDEQRRVLTTLPRHQMDELRWRWPVWAHPGQLEPPGDWRTWLIRAGRGFGKTRAGAEWVGPARGFRLRDPFDSVASGELLGVGDSVARRFDLVRRYGASVRRITRPVAGSVRVFLDGIETAGFAMDGGAMVLDAAPAAEVAVTATFVFDVPVRFAEDRLSVTRATFLAGAARAGVRGHAGDVGRDRRRLRQTAGDVHRAVRQRGELPRRALAAGDRPADALSWRMTVGERALAAARGCLGVRFRAQGRDPALGLDCVGLAAIAAGCAASVPRRYAMRTGSLAVLADAMAAAGLAPINADNAGAGDIVAYRTGAGQLHLAVRGVSGIVHADAAAGRVVERADPQPWPIAGAWRSSEE